MDAAVNLFRFLYLFPKLCVFAIDHLQAVGTDVLAPPISNSFFVPRLDHFSFLEVFLDKAVLADLIGSHAAYPEQALLVGDVVLLSLDVGH